MNLEPIMDEELHLTTIPIHNTWHMLTKLKWLSTSSAVLSPEQANFTFRGPVGSERSDPTSPAKPSYTLEALAQELKQEVMQEFMQLKQVMEGRVQQVEEQVQQVRQDSSYKAMATTSRYEKGRFVLEAAGQPDDELVGKQTGAAWDSNSSWDDCRLKELPEATRDGNPSVQHYFNQLLKVQPCTDPDSSAQLCITDTHSGAKQSSMLMQAFGGRPDAVVHPAGTQPLPTNLVAIIELKNTNDALSDDSTGQAVAYAQHMLRHAVGPSRTSVLVAVTDLRVIRWFRVSRNSEGGFRYRVAPPMDDVKGTLTWLLHQTPEQLGAVVPRFYMGAQAGSAQELTVKGFLGSGATSEVYQAVTPDEQVRGHGLAAQCELHCRACACSSAMLVAGHDSGMQQGPACCTDAGHTRCLLIGARCCSLLCSSKCSLCI